MTSPLPPQLLDWSSLSRFEFMCAGLQVPRHDCYRRCERHLPQEIQSHVNHSPHAGAARLLGGGDTCPGIHCRLGPWLLTFCVWHSSTLTNESAVAVEASYECMLLEFSKCQCSPHNHPHLLSQLQLLRHVHVVYWLSHTHHTHEEKPALLATVKFTSGHRLLAHTVHSTVNLLFTGGADARPFVTYHNSLSRKFTLRIAT